MDLPRSEKGIRIYLPDDAELEDGSNFINFYHLDGMYSYCKTEKGGLIHLSGLTPLVEYKDGYKMKEPDDTTK